MMKETASYSSNFRHIKIEHCPLCDNKTQIRLYIEKKRGQRPFYQCDVCQLIFVPAQHQLSPEKEKARYDLHNNDPNNNGYIKFLNKLAEPVHQKISPKSNGINFGSGPEPILSDMLESHEHTMSNYDLYYANDMSVLQKTYDFLISSEVVEHFSSPVKEWKLMDGLLKKGGWMGIMTQLYKPEIDFSKWWYKSDQTHIAFYSKETFEWIGRKFGYDIEFMSDSVILLKKQFPKN